MDRRKGGLHMEEHGTVKDAAAMYLYGKRAPARKAHLLDQIRLYL